MRYTVSLVIGVLVTFGIAKPDPVTIVINEDFPHNEQTVNLSIIDSTLLLCEEMLNPTHTGCEQVGVLVPPVSDQIDFVSQGLNKTLIRISSDGFTDPNEPQDFGDLNEPEAMTPDIIAFLEPDTLPETITYHPVSGQPGFSPNADITYVITSDPVPEPSSVFVSILVIGLAPMVRRFFPSMW